MDQIKAALTGKVGPLPGWAWAGIAVLGGFLIAPHLSGLFGSSSSGSTNALNPDPNALMQPVAGPPGAQGLPGPSGPPGPLPAPAPVPAPAQAPPQGHRTHVVVSGDTLWGIAQTYLGNGARWPEIYALSSFRSGDPNLIFPGEIATLPLPAGGPAIGGGAVGSRRTTLMSYFHPDLNRKVRYPQLIAVGGPASAHRGNVHRVAAQAGVHPARLLALNPTHRGLIRVA